MGLIGEQDAAEIREQLKGMVNPVRLVHFTQELNLEYGREAKELLHDLAALSEKLSVEVYNFQLDREKVAEYKVDKVPATVVCDGRASGIRFYGLPAGYEFTNLLDAVLSVSSGESGLSQETKQKLAQITEPVRLQVFVTPT